jgi:UDP-N-acetylmuramoylalanine--D-glutamate ligase
MIPVTHLAGKRVVVFGLGMSGIASAQGLRAGGARPVVWDDGEKGRATAIEAGFEPVDLREADWSAFAALILAPGVPLTHPVPHWTVDRARAAGVEVIGDTELFCRERRHLGSRAKVAAITGTNGKSTTTALTHHLLGAAGRRAVIGGNFGTAVLALDPLADDTHYVIEYSSFQIDLTPTLDANTACLLNVTPDHLDRHGTLENYASVKSRIFDRLGSGDTAVIGVDDPLSDAIADVHARHTDVQRISVERPVVDGVYATASGLIEVVGGREQPPLSLAGIGSLRGVHNWQNAACAYAMTRALGLRPEEIAAGLRSFPGLAHRMEEVGRLGRVLFINDSKATNADAAAKALASFDNIYWIAGGLAKAGGLAGLEIFWPKIRRAYLIGDAAQAFSAQIGDGVPHQISGTLEMAIAVAARDAQNSGGAEPVVLLSPACASYDQFPSFTARGDAFKAIVGAMRGIALRGAEAA